MLQLLINIFNVIILTKFQSCSYYSAFTIHIYTKVIPKVSDLDILDNNIFRNLYISEMCILCGLMSLLRL